MTDDHHYDENEEHERGHLELGVICQTQLIGWLSGPVGLLFKWGWVKLDQNIEMISSEGHVQKVETVGDSGIPVSRN